MPKPQLDARRPPVEQPNPINEFALILAERAPRTTNSKLRCITSLSARARNATQHWFGSSFDQWVKLHRVRKFTRKPKQLCLHIDRYINRSIRSIICHYVDKWLSNYDGVIISTWELIWNHSIWSSWTASVEFVSPRWNVSDLFAKTTTTVTTAESNNKLAKFWSLWGATSAAQHAKWLPKQNPQRSHKLKPQSTSRRHLQQNEHPIPASHLTRRGLRSRRRPSRRCWPHQQRLR